MNLAHIVPPQWEGTLFNRGYKMALAHWVLEYPTYVEALQESSAYILLDNGAFEGAQVSVPDLVRAAQLIGADEVVLPDVRGDAKATLQSSWAALGQVETQSVMFVPQGRVEEDRQACLDSWMSRWDEWRGTYDLTIGVTSLRGEGLSPQIGTRKSFLLPNSRAPLHLLGLGDVHEFSYWELPAALSVGVRSIDTSLAFALGAEGVLLTPDIPKIYLKNPAAYLALSTHRRNLIRLNVLILEQWIEEGVVDYWIPIELVRQATIAPTRKVYASPRGALCSAGVPPGKWIIRQVEGQISVRPTWAGYTSDLWHTITEIPKES